MSSIDDDAESGPNADDELLETDENTYCSTVSDTDQPLCLRWKLMRALQAGSRLRIVASGLRVLLNDYDIHSLVIRLPERSLEPPVLDRFSREAFKQRRPVFVREPCLLVVEICEGVPAGAEVCVSGALSPMTYIGRHSRYRLESAPDPQGTWQPVSRWVRLDVQAGEAAQMEACFRADGRLHVRYLDRFYNPAAPGRRHLKALTPDGREYARATTEDSSWCDISSADPEQASAERVMVRGDHGLQALSSARPRPGIDGRRVYFGEIHWHSEFSGDGCRPLRECLEWARDDLALDFASPGDHYPYSRLEQYLDLADEYNDPGSFATLLGYEMSIGAGHFNVYFRNREVARRFQSPLNEVWSHIEETEPSRLWLDPIYSSFAPDEILMVPHHTNMTSLTKESATTPQGYAVWRNFDWRAADDRYMRVAEICQLRGSFETEEIEEGWRMLSGGYGSSLRTALARGLRFGFIGGTDNHDGWPVRANPHHPLYVLPGPWYAGLTAVQAPCLTREAIFEALRARRAYATSGPRIVLDFTLNDEHPMGSVAPLPGRAERAFRIYIRGTAPLERVEIIHQGVKLASLPTNASTDLDCTWTDPRRDMPVENCYYYLRLRQADGHCAWSSPIWVDYRLPT